MTIERRGVYRIKAPVLRVSKFVSNRYHKAYFHIVCHAAVFRLFYSRLDEAKRGEEVLRARTPICSGDAIRYSLWEAAVSAKTSKETCVGDINYKWWMRRVAIYPRDLHYYFWDIEQLAKTIGWGARQVDVDGNTVGITITARRRSLPFLTAVLVELLSSSLKGPSRD